MKILFIQTGGTIDKDYPKTKNGYAFEIAEPAVKRILAKQNISFEYEICSLMRKDSLDISDEERKLIVTFCAQTNYTKIIITHGTDTMIETAKALSKIKNKTIIITGSFRPERFTNSDADFNLGTAIGAINIMGEGTYIAICGLIFNAKKIARSDDGSFCKIS